jgi:hypothetical protein
MFAASDFSEPGHASPRAAAFAGLILSLLLIVGLVNRSSAGPGHRRRPSAFAREQTYNVARHLSYILLNVFAIKMAGAFTLIAGMIVLRTGVLPPWVAFSGFGCGAVLLLVIGNWPWIALLFPLWILQMSACILGARLSRRNKKAVAGGLFLGQQIR